MTAESRVSRGLAQSTCTCAHTHAHTLTRSHLCLGFANSGSREVFGKAGTEVG